MPQQQYTEHKVLANTSDGGIIVIAHEQHSGAEHILKKEPHGALNHNLQREERVLKRLASRGVHPNIVQVKDSFSTTESKVLVLEYCGNGDLFSKIESSGGLGTAKTLQIFNQLASSLWWLHSNDVAHRDISLENILVDSTGDIRLADFGLAWEDCSQLCKSWVGKELYIAPEAQTSSSTRPYAAKQADMWSLGVCLFTCITGVPPVNIAKVCDQRFRLICEGRLEDMVKAWGFRDQIDDNAMDLINKLLTPNPQDRINIDQVMSHPWLVQCKPIVPSPVLEPQPAGQAKPTTADFRVATAA
jgi:serine/threonine-protein kinase Chk2